MHMHAFEAALLSLSGSIALVFWYSTQSKHHLLSHLGNLFLPCGVHQKRCSLILVFAETGRIYGINVLERKTHIFYMSLGTSGKVFNIVHASCTEDSIFTVSFHRYDLSKNLNPGIVTHNRLEQAILCGVSCGCRGM